MFSVISSGWCVCLRKIVCGCVRNGWLICLWGVFFVLNFVCFGWMVNGVGCVVVFCFIVIVRVVLCVGMD